MTKVTIGQFATDLNVSVDRVIGLLKAAGVSAAGAAYAATADSPGAINPTRRSVAA